MAIKKIRLSAENMFKYGFARFFTPGEVTVVNDVWLRKIETGPSAPGNSADLEIEVASDLMIQLSDNDEQKITSKKEFAIVSGVQTINNMYFLSQRAGWNQTARDIKTLVRLNPAASFLAILRAGDNPMALGSGLVLQAAESLAWIGMILVHKELRRQGIARALMKQCISFACRDLATPCIGLDATPMGLPLYSSLGFKESFRIWRSTLRTEAFIENPVSGKTAQLSSLDSIYYYLKKRSLTDKKTLLGILFKHHKKGCFTVKSGDEIAGVVWSRPGRLKPFVGPLVADSVETARSLLQQTLKYWLDKGHDAVFLDIPESHFKDRLNWDDINESRLVPQHCILHEDIKAVRQFSRMYLLNDKNETNHNKTVLYMEKEKNIIQPYLFSTGGPEMS